MELPFDNHGGNKGDKRKQTILVAVGVIGVILTYLLYRRASSGGSSSTVSSTPVDTTTATGGDGTPENTSWSDLGGKTQWQGDGTSPDTPPTTPDWVTGLQTDLEALTASMTAAQTTQAANTTQPVAQAPAASTPATGGFSLVNAVKDIYIRNDTTGGIYQVDKTTGVSTLLSGSDWASVRGAFGSKTVPLTHFTSPPAATAPPKKAVASATTGKVAVTP